MTCTEITTTWQAAGFVALSAAVLYLATGDISVATTSGPIDPTVLHGVRDADVLLSAR